MTNNTLSSLDRTNACEWCGEDKGSRPKYCSATCSRQYSYRNRRNDHPECSHPNCGKPMQAKGLCGSHYGLMWRKKNKNHNYTCHQCGKKYRTGRKSRSKYSFCGWDCQLQWTNEDPENESRREAARQAAKDSKPLIRKMCAWCNQGFETLANATKYCAEICKKNAAEDRRIKSLTPLRYALECGDDADIIDVLKDGSKHTLEGCWEWGRIDRNGYPTARIGGRNVGVHRLSLEARLGAPLGTQAAHHKCANAKCVNPEHLQPVTHRENIAEMLARRSYINRIKELEQALSELAPGHEVLDRVAVL